MSVETKIRQLIERENFITIDRFMQEALSQRHNSYYKKLNHIGEKGDFITAPEISQIFGEVIGLWCIENWIKMGSPAKCSLVELGPGRGVLMRDLLKTAQLVPEFFKSLQVNLVEINPNFIHQQKLNLKPYSIEIYWHSDINSTPQIPSIFIANEFFDALPIKQYIRTASLWYEIVIKINPSTKKLTFDQLPLTESLQESFLLHYDNAPEGAIIEESEQSLDHLKFIIQNLNTYPGAACIIDYGYYLPQRQLFQYNSTLQAIMNHKYCQAFESLGEADISAHVDFFAIAKVAAMSPALHQSFGTQAEFLHKYGVMLRGNLLAMRSPIDAKVIERQIERLISPKEMGELFKVLTVSSCL